MYKSNKCVNVDYNSTTVSRLPCFLFLNFPRYLLSYLLICSMHITFLIYAISLDAASERFNFHLFFASLLTIIGVINLITFREHRLSTNCIYFHIFDHLLNLYSIKFVTATQYFFPCCRLKWLLIASITFYFY